MLGSCWGYEAKVPRVSGNEPLGEAKERKPNEPPMQAARSAQAGLENHERRGKPLFPLIMKLSGGFMKTFQKGVVASRETLLRS